VTIRRKVPSGTGRNCPEILQELGEAGAPPGKAKASRHCPPGLARKRDLPGVPDPTHYKKGSDAPRPCRAADRWRKEIPRPGSCGFPKLLARPSRQKKAAIFYRRTESHFGRRPFRSAIRSNGRIARRGAFTTACQLRRPARRGPDGVVKAVGKCTS